MKIEKIISKLEKVQDKFNEEMDGLRDMLELHLEEMESNNYDESEDSDDSEDLEDSED